MKTFLRIYEEDIQYEPTDKIEDLIYVQEIENDLVEVGLNIKLSPNLQEKELVLLEYIETGLYLRQELLEEFLAFLSFEYKTVAIFMRLSDGKHPSDCLRNLFMKYCRDYQKKTLSIFQYLQICQKRWVGNTIEEDENLLVTDYVKEAEIHYETTTIQVHFECDSIWKEEDGVEIANEEISLFLNEAGMRKATITFSNPCLIEKE